MFLKGLHTTAANLFSFIKPPTPTAHRKSENTCAQTTEPVCFEPEKEPEKPDYSSERRSDLDRALDGNLSRLDSLISKAETAEISMHEQRKQMTSFLKK